MAKSCTTFDLASVMLAISKALFRIRLHFFRSITTRVYIIISLYKKGINLIFLIFGGISL